MEYKVRFWENCSRAEDECLMKGKGVLVNLRSQPECGKGNFRVISRFKGHSIDMMLVKKNMPVAVKALLPVNQPTPLQP